MNRATHHCPACGAALPAMARHPWYICALCRDRIADAEGYLLEFGNTSVSGGFAWRRIGEGAFQEALGYLGLLDGRPVRVSAARFGGIVAEARAVFPEGNLFRHITVKRPDLSDTQPPPMSASWSSSGSKPSIAAMPPNVRI
jgi:hypothetical protein